MLEQMRRNSRSVLIWTLFGIIIVVFIISFGPQSQGATCDQSMGEDLYAAKVAGQTITNNAMDSCCRAAIASHRRWPARNGSKSW
jgi:hypothetical protein